jgi:hypothetical protein
MNPRFLIAPASVMGLGVGLSAQHSASLEPTWVTAKP